MLSVALTDEAIGLLGAIVVVGFGVSFCDQLSSRWQRRRRR